MKPLATGGLIIALCGATLLCRALFAPSATARQNPAPRAINPINPDGLIYPNGLALDDKGDLLISDIGAHRVLKLDSRGRLTVIAATGGLRQRRAFSRRTTWRSIRRETC